VSPETEQASAAVPDELQAPRPPRSSPTTWRPVACHQFASYVRDSTWDSSAQLVRAYLARLAGGQETQGTRVSVPCKVFSTLRATLRRSHSSRAVSSLGGVRETLHAGQGTLRQTGTGAHPRIPRSLPHARDLRCHGRRRGCQPQYMSWVSTRMIATNSGLGFGRSFPRSDFYRTLWVCCPHCYRVFR
jgi:hypothetical protein